MVLHALDTALEARVVLSTLAHHPHYYGLDDVHYNSQFDNTRLSTPFTPQKQPSAKALAGLDNDGKIVSGTDREGDQWTITVHGPGSVIVSDTTPNDGVLDDDIDTIQLIGTNVNKSYVTSTVRGSAEIRTDGVVRFNRLIGDGAASVLLNGFTLARTRTPGVELNQDPEIFLPQGVRQLRFHDIEANIDTAQATGFELNTKPYQIVIGDPTTPLPFKPTIRIDSILNTSYSSAYNATRTAGTQTPDAQPDSLTPPTGPLTTPSVEFDINGELHGLEIVSATIAPIENPLQAGPTGTHKVIGNQDQFSIVGNTGRTAVRALGIDVLRVKGSAKNFTVSRDAQPHTDAFSGISHIHKAEFGGTADAVALDVNGPIGTLRFNRGLGDPTDNQLNSPVSTMRSGANLGVSFTKRGYPSATNPADPTTGKYGGLVTATHIGKLEAGSARTRLLQSNNPALLQAQTTGRNSYIFKPGEALTAAAITTSGDIGAVKIGGDTTNSEVQAGFDYQNFANGANSLVSASSIGPVHQTGDSVDSVVASTYAPGADNTFNTGDDVVGNGKISGRFEGSLNTYGANGASLPTVLGRQGTGFYAFRKAGQLPPPDGATRVKGVLVR